MITIFKDTKKRANPFASYTAPDGTRYPRIPTELLEEVPEPAAPEDYSEDLYYRTEQDDYPYIAYTRKSDEQIMKTLLQKYERALDEHLDSVAKQYRYNDRFTFALRAGYPGPWQAEGIAFAQWMDSVNHNAFQLLISVQEGSTPALSIEEFISNIPPFVSPTTPQ